MGISTSKFEKLLIAREAERIGAKRLLEIGAFKGKTTAVMSEAAARTGGYVVVIDPMKWASRPAHVWEWFDGLFHPFSYERHFWRNVNRAGHDNVWLVRGLSTDPTILADPDPRLAEFDLVFIDGEHTYETAAADIRHWGRRVREGGCILIHDCIARFPGVIRAVRELMNDPRYAVKWPENSSIAIVDVLAPTATLPPNLSTNPLGRENGNGHRANGNGHERNGDAKQNHVGDGAEITAPASASAVVFERSPRR